MSPNPSEAPRAAIVAPAVRRPLVRVLRAFAWSVLARDLVPNAVSFAVVFLARSPDATLGPRHACVLLLEVFQDVVGWRLARSIRGPRGAIFGTAVIAKALVVAWAYAPRAIGAAVMPFVEPAFALFYLAALVGARATTRAAVVALVAALAAWVGSMLVDEGSLVAMGVGLVAELAATITVAVAFFRAARAQDESASQ